MKIFRTWVLVVGVIGLSLLAAQANAVESKIETRIIGGAESVEGKWPWMVALSFAGVNSTALEASCGATLIHQDWVMTAAHCMHDDIGLVIPPADLAAYVGAYNLSTSTGTSRSVSKIIVHPSYNPDTIDNDIALLKLSSPVTSIEPVNIINSSVSAVLESLVDDPEEVSDLSVIGWGTTDAAAPFYPTILHDVSLPYVSNLVCNDGPLAGQVTANMMCAGFIDGGKDSCQGDSGGPLVHFYEGRFYQAGIVSWGYGCAEARTYGVYTRVEKYLDWLQVTINGYNITTNVDFGTWIAGKTIRSELTIENDGGVAFDILSLSLNTTDFSILGHTCGVAVESIETCSVGIEFISSISGIYSDTLSIDTNPVLIPEISLSISATVIDEVFFDNVNADAAVQWGMSGNGLWGEELESGIFSGYTLRSGVISDNQKSSLFAYVDIEAGVNQRDISFDWKVSSEDNFDFLEIWVDNQRVAAISGETDWVNKVIALQGAGSHVIEWRYKKDYLDPDTLDVTDAGWIRNIQLDVVTSTSSGGGSLSLWSAFGLPLLMMRRRYKLH